MNFITRFAPSPTGPLHLGHAYSAMLAFELAQAAGGRFNLRIDDLDRTRSRARWTDLIFEDLHWLGLSWPEPVWYQSARLPRYRDALNTLWELGLLYPCSCSRADIHAAVSAPQEGVPLQGPDGIVYPGTCRPSAPPRGPLPEMPLRLNMARALVALGGFPEFSEEGRGPQGQSGRIIPEAMTELVGDVALVRHGMGASYHLAIVCDDADQGVTHVVRGQDLFEATQIHVLLQGLLRLPVPIYRHHRLVRDETGKRLAKRDDARSISTYRRDGATPADIRRLTGL